MAKLVKAVFVRDSRRHRTVLLAPGEDPEPHLAVLVTNPACWEGGKLPSAVKKTAAKDESGGEGNDPGDASATPSAAADPVEGDDGADTKPAAKKTAARTPARGRKAADQGDSGQ